MITQRDLAKKLNLSQATISMALQDSPKISPKIRAAIQKKSKEMGYVPSPDLRSLSLRKKVSSRHVFRSTIAVIGEWQSPQELKPHPVYEGYWKGILQQSEKLGYTIDYFPWNPQKPDFNLPKVLRARGISGVILLPYIQPTTFDHLDTSHLAVVTFGYSILSPNFHRISHNHYQSLYKTLSNLKPGHFKKIGFASFSDHRLMNLWTAAYLTYHETIKQQPLPIFFHDKNLNEANFNYWYEKNKPDLILTSDPVSVHSALKKLKVKVPETTSILSHSKRDDQTWFTGITEESIECGVAAINWLDQLVCRHQYGPPATGSLLLVSGKLVLGKSLSRNSLTSTAI